MCVGCSVASDGEGNLVRKGIATGLRPRNDVGDYVIASVSEVISFALRRSKKDCGNQNTVKLLADISFSVIGTR